MALLPKDPPAKPKPVLSFDPGSQNNCGFAVISKDNKLIKYGCIEQTTKLDLGQRLKTIYRYVTNLITVWEPEVIVCEDQFAGKNVKSLMVIREVTAVIRLAAAEAGVPFKTFANNTVKKAVTGDGRSAKEKVKEAVTERYSIVEDITNDNITDAIAIGACYLAKAEESDE